MNQSQFEFDIHEGPDLKDGVSKFEFNPFINNKVIASYRKNKQKNFINLTLNVNVFLVSGHI
jgi:hypothetical protein